MRPSTDYHTFKTIEEAVSYCKNHGLNVSPANAQIFDIANSLFQAFEKGLLVGVQAFREQPIYIDVRAEAAVVRDGLLTVSIRAYPETVPLVEKYISSLSLQSVGEV